MCLRGLPALLVFALAPVACASDGDEKCAPPVVDGNTALSRFENATATVYGSGVLPAETRDGLVLWLSLNDGSSSSSVFLPTKTPSQTCGRSFSFVIHELPAGTYRLAYELHDAPSGSIQPVLSGTSTNDFTLTNRDRVEFTPVF